MENRDINNLKYCLEYKGIKNIHLRVNKDGVLVVSAPYGSNKKDIDNLIINNLNWYQKVLKKKTITQTNNQERYLWGQKYEINFKQKPKKFEVKDNKIYVCYPNDNENSINSFINKQLIKLLEKEVNQIKPEFDGIILDYHLQLPTKIKYRSMETRWGVCQTKKKEITLNTKLVNYPKECLKYVLLHEYLHLIVPNHSQRFHDLMDYYMPNNKEIKSLLNNYANII